MTTRDVAGTIGQCLNQIMLYKEVLGAGALRLLRTRIGCWRMLLSHATKTEMGNRAGMVIARDNNVIGAKPQSRRM